MLIVMRSDATADEIDDARERLEAMGLRTRIAGNGSNTVVACPDADDAAALPWAGRAAPPAVQSTLPDADCMLASRRFNTRQTLVRAGDDAGTVFGASAVVVIAGPCSVEGLDMLRDTARAVQAAGATLLRGGAFKPRSSPWSFQGLGESALAMLARVRAETRMPVVTEVMDARQIERVAAHADMLQVGARNMQNFALLSELGRIRRPILLKRGMAATVKELLLAAEYILVRGNTQVILCERGIRTFESATRNTLECRRHCRAAQGKPFARDRRSQSRGRSRRAGSVARPGRDRRGRGWPDRGSAPAARSRTFRW